MEQVSFTTPRTVEGVVVDGNKLGLGDLLDAAVQYLDDADVFVVDKKEPLDTRVWSSGPQKTTTSLGNLGFQFELWIRYEPQHAGMLTVALATCGGKVTGKIRKVTPYRDDHSPTIDGKDTRIFFQTTIATLDNGVEVPDRLRFSFSQPIAPESHPPNLRTIREVVQAELARVYKAARDALTSGRA